MNHSMLSWSFGNPTGWAIACGFFLLLSIGLGWLAYSLSQRLLTMGSLDQEQQAGRRVSVVLGTLLALAIFSALSVTSLTGFSRLDLRDDQLTMHYMLPERTVVLPFIEVMNVQEEPAFKGQGRLVLITDTSGTYESALASRADVHRAGEFLRQQMAQPYSLHQ